jgi:hypothetical protein
MCEKSSKEKKGERKQRGTKRRENARLEVEGKEGQKNKQKGQGESYVCSRSRSNINKGKIEGNYCFVLNT